MKTILYQPIFINPQAYFVFPQLYHNIDKTGYKACSSVIGNKIRLTQLKYYKLIDSSNLNSYKWYEK